MNKIQTQGVHHITFVGSNREAIIDFYQGVLGMPLIFEQPNLDVPSDSHLSDAITELIQRKIKIPA